MGSASITHIVGPEHTALAVGSGDVDVLGTPVLLAWCEEATCDALSLDPEQTSVGARIEIDHLIPSPVGTTIIANADLIARDGRLVTFRVEAVDTHGALVASGQIRRIVVNRDRFLARVPHMGD
ncbi:MAG: thioesterase family protein [Aeromicrobium sp.]